nr:MAG TPA: hypothetical protein [Caudoviricetes sp.]
MRQAVRLRRLSRLSPSRPNLTRRRQAMPLYRGNGGLFYMRRGRGRLVCPVVLRAVARR